MKSTLVILSIAIALPAIPCWGAIIYDISMNTQPLVGHAAGPFSLEFQLNDGSGTGDGNNTAVLSNLVFGGGAVSGAPVTFGGASGGASGSVTLTDSSFFNQFIQPFTPGAALSFRLNLSTNVDPGGIPDEFTFAILDGSGAELRTLNSFLNVFAQIDIDSANPTVLTFGSDPSRAPANGGSAINIAPPVSTSVIPEPGTCLLLAGGIAYLAVRARRRNSFRR